VTPAPAATTPVPLADTLAVADPSGALWLPATATLVVADLHLEKGSRFAQRGQPLPPYDTAETLGRLEAVVARLAPARMVALGDSFDDGGASRRMTAADRRRLATLVARVPDWLWIAGNHDPSPIGPWGGAVLPEWRLGPIAFRHEADRDPGPGEVSGHYHPKARLNLGVRRLSAPCFVTDGRRLILPAFGAFTGGLDVLDPAIDRLFPAGFTALIVARGRVLPAARARLLRDG
jgi:hypothetical protein